MKSADPDLVVLEARRWLGTPYHHQASLPGVGCDCLGLARGVWRELIGREPEAIPPYSTAWGEVGRVETMAEGARRWMIEIDPSDAVRGDVVLFRMRQGAIAKHCGILSGHDDRAGVKRFIHAYERVGVREEYLTKAWQRRIAFAFRYPEIM